MTRPTPGWWPTEGTEPDPRWSLANERTLLAYNRTALAFLVAGLAVAASHSAADTPAWLAAIGLPLITTSAVIARAGRGRFVDAQHAMRNGLPLPVPRAAAFISQAVMAIAAAGVVLAALQLLL